MEKMKHIIGHPIFAVGDFVEFDCTNQYGVKYHLVGQVYIVDAWGTFDQNDEPSYDIMSKAMVGDEGCLYKHNRESLVTASMKTACSCTCLGSAKSK